MQELAHLGVYMRYGLHWRIRLPSFHFLKLTADVWVCASFVWNCLYTLVLKMLVTYFGFLKEILYSIADDLLYNIYSELSCFDWICCTSWWAVFSILIDLHLNRFYFIWVIDMLRWICRSNCNGKPNTIDMHLIVTCFNWK